MKPSSRFAPLNMPSWWPPNQAQDISPECPSFFGAIILCPYVWHSRRDHCDEEIDV
jgi:hypothetical protein